MSQEFVSVPREWLTQVSLMQMSHEELQDQAVEFLCEPCDEPAPPSGGEAEESFEYRLACLGSIDRCDVACGSYGDKFQRWDDAGPYVEHDDHLRHIEFYAVEVERLNHNVTRLQAENAALQQRLNVADQRIDELEAELTNAKRGYEWESQRAAALLEELQEYEGSSGSLQPSLKENHGVPGTSFQRLNQLANEGE